MTFWENQLLTGPHNLRSEFDPELFSHSAYVNFFCEICDKIAVVNILRQNKTIFVKEDG